MSEKQREGHATAGAHREGWQGQHRGAGAAQGGDRQPPPLCLLLLPRPLAARAVLATGTGEGGLCLGSMLELSGLQEPLLESKQSKQLHPLSRVPALQ